VVDPDRPLRRLEVAARIEELRRLRDQESRTEHHQEHPPATVPESTTAAVVPEGDPAAAETTPVQHASGSAASTIAGLLRAGGEGLLH
jgi:hypothetical protein